MVIAWLEVHVDRGAGGIDALQRPHLGVQAAGLLVPALADDFSVACDNAADPRIRRSGEEPALGERERAAHHRLVKGAELRL